MTLSKVNTARGFVLTLLLAVCGVAAAQEPPVVVKGPSGEAIYVSAAQKEGHDQYGFAGAYRAGDFLFVSGVVVGAWDGETLDMEGMKDAIRDGFNAIERILTASGADFDDVADLITFHIWDSELFAGTKAEQLQAIVDVKREFMDEPDPAWTAVGTTALVPDRGIIEIRATAYVPNADN